jgi:hypothetical protein
VLYFVELVVVVMTATASAVVVVLSAARTMSVRAAALVWVRARRWLHH